MLEKYIVENFKSFKNETIVDLKRTNYKVLDDTNVENDILKGALFVGANASGKSNIVLAIKLLLDLLFGKSDVNLDQYYSFFSSSNTMKLEYCFNIANTKIKYAVHYQRKDKLLIEKLIFNEDEILNRLGSTAHSTITERTDYDDVPAGTLLLRDIWFNTKFRGNPILQRWFEFLSNSIYFDLIDQEGILYKENDISLKKYVEEHGVYEINEFFKEYGFEQTIEYKAIFDLKENVTSYHIENELYFKRAGIDVSIPFSVESLGNRMLLNTLPALFHVIKNDGILIFDEFSSGFHNDLEKLLIKYFMKKSKNSQLMLVSHSTNLLSTSLFRPDQLYAVNFNKEGSNIVRFSVEQPRVGQNLEKMYLGGVFSGLPNYREEFETE